MELQTVQEPEIRTHYEVRVDFLSGSRPQAEKYRTHSETFQGLTMQEAISKAEENVGGFPKKPRPIFRDLEDGSAEQVGIVFHRWVQKCEPEDWYGKYWAEYWIKFVRVKTQASVPERYNTEV